CSFVATSFPRLHSNGFLVLGLSEIKGIHIKSSEFVRLERCHKTGSSTNFSCHDTFIIVIDNLPHAIRYRPRRWP
ncbi:unnamed protein product, partial [Larinioides sclopetarius]